MSNIFVFNPSDFREAYPQFSKLTDEQLNWFFEMANGDLLDNSPSSCINLKTRKKLFYLLVAHFAELQNRIDNGNSSLVGRVSSATEGSVSIGVDYNMGTGALEQWLKQTPYGATFYALTAKYRTALWFAAEKPMPVNRNGWRFFWGRY